MVEINFCPECDKTSREHFARERACQDCGSKFMKLTIPLPMVSWLGIFLMVLWLPVLVIGFFQYLGNAGETRYLGYIGAGIGLALLSIFLQMLGSGQMLKKALERAHGSSEGPDDGEEEEMEKVQVVVKKKIARKMKKGEEMREEKPVKAVKRIKAPKSGGDKKKARVPSGGPGIRDMSEILAEKND